jgi:hypothetical protein
MTPQQIRAQRRAAMTGTAERRPSSRPVLVAAQQPPAAQQQPDPQLERMRRRLLELESPAGDI